MTARSAALAAFKVARRLDPVPVAFYKRNTGVESPFSVVTPAITATTELAVGIAAHRRRGLEPSDEGRRESVLQVTIQASDLSRKPVAGDRVVVDSIPYTVGSCDTAVGCLYIIALEGAAPTVTTSSDITPPRFATAVATGGVGQFTYTGTTVGAEAVVHRYRYRTPPTFGTWVTSAYSTPAAHPIAGTSVALTASTYEVQLQCKDAAGNESAWTAAGTVIVSGAPG